MPKFIDRSGQTFARLAVIAYQGHQKYLCRCICGTEKIIRTSDLVTGNTKSCGCLNIETIINRSTTHGKSNTREYSRWKNMMRRCYSIKNQDYHDYGARGIYVEQNWHDFAIFLQDTGTPPTTHHTLERIDNNGAYSLQNCYWATPKDQARNTRSNHMLSFKGITMCLAAWAEKFDIPPHMLRTRLRRGWTIERALHTKPKNATK